MAVELSVVAPCFNEEENIPLLVTRVLDMLRDNGINGELILINDGSEDETRAALERASTKHDKVVAVHHDTNKGITESWATGLAHSIGRFVVTIDADMQYRPEDIPALYQKIVANDYDLVQGWRDTYKENSLLRKFLSRGLSGLLNLLFFKRVRDIKSGFVVYRREVYEAIMLDRFHFQTYQHFMILNALAAGFKFCQVPVSFDPRTKGESFITHPFRFSTHVVADLPKALWRYGLFSRFVGRRSN